MTCEIFTCKNLKILLSAIGGNHNTDSGPGIIIFFFIINSYINRHFITTLYLYKRIFFYHKSINSFFTKGNLLTFLVRDGILVVLS